MTVTEQWQYIIAMVAGVLVLISGLVLVLTLKGSDLAPLGWLLVVVGVLTLAGNFMIKTRPR